MILQGDCKEKLKEINDNSIDLICTDPPYGYSFMNKDWDKAIVTAKVWRECLRVLKPGSFAFIMSAPRQDVLYRVNKNLEEAGFNIGFTSIYWAYASGFPKAMNISKAVDKKGGVGMNKDFCKLIKRKREEANLSLTELAELGNFYGKINHGGTVSNWEKGLGIPTLEQYNKLIKIFDLGDYPAVQEAKREVIAREKMTIGIGGNSPRLGSEKITSLPETEQAKKLDGSYAGFQPKPALEVILVCMKPLSEKNYVEQALTNSHGVTWLDDCRIPYKNNDYDNFRSGHFKGNITSSVNPTSFNTSKPLTPPHPQGRFPANLLVSDNALDIGKITKSSGDTRSTAGFCAKSEIYKNKEKYKLHNIKTSGGDSGDFSRYYSLDSWEAQFIITPKPSKSEKNKGLENFVEKQVNDGRNIPPDNAFQRGKTLRNNTHPTVKPIKLFKYLISLGSREGDTILDPFMGSGTTALAAQQLFRKWVGIEINPEYVEIIKARTKQEIIPF